MTRTDPAVVVARAADDAELRTLAALAERIWNEHYPGLISQAQIDTMLERGYALPALRADLAAGVRYRLARVDRRPVGFTGHGPDTDDPDTLWLHKLYVHADYRRRGVAGALFDTALAHAVDRACGHIRLRVNRGNDAAMAAYARLGFAVERDHVKDIGQGFVMDDHILVRAVG